MREHKLDESYIPLVMEECGEVLQALGKCVRFGPENFWKMQGNRPNYVVLAYEIGGLLEILGRLNLDPLLVAEGRRKKIEKLKIFGPEVWTPGIGDAVATEEATSRCITP